MPNKIRVLGIDPGFGRLGIAILEGGGGGDKLLFSHCFETDKHDTFAHRLAQISKYCEEIIAKWKPARLAIEKLFFTANVKTAMQVAEVRGVIINLCSRHGLSVHEYSPQEVKIAVTSNGRASKHDVASMILRLIPEAKNKIGDKKHDDEYDAIAVAIADIHSKQK